MITKQFAIRKLSAACITAAMLMGIHAPSGAVTVSYVSTSLNPAQKFNLRVDGKPFYMTSVQVRLDKLRYYWNFSAADREAVIARAAADGFNTVSIPIHWYEVEPQKDVFNWAILEEYLGLASKYNLKLELLWFGQNSGGWVQWLGDPAANPVHLRTPDYVLYSPGPGSAATTSEFTIKRTSSDYTLDLADPNLLAREKYVLGQVMNHIASWDTANGSKHTVIGLQLNNEVRGRSVQFSADQIAAYMSQLGSVVKASPYSVWTRLNCVNGDTNSRITSNEALRANGGTSLDFVGVDVYGVDTATVQTIIPYNAFNFRMIMESGAEIDAAARMQVAALGGNNGYSHYDFLGPDGHGLYDRVGNTGFQQHGSYVDDVRLVNRLFNGVNQDLALKSNGYGLFVHNIRGNSTTPTTGVEGISYAPSVATDSAVSITHSNTEIVLLNMKGGTFSWPSTLGINGAQRGYFDSNNTWVNEGAVAYSSTGMTAPAGTIVRLTRPDTGKVTGVRRQAEFATFGGGSIQESSSLGFAGNGYVNPTASGAWIEWPNVDGRTGGTRTILIRYANGSTTDRTVRLLINGSPRNVVLPMTGAWTSYVQLPVIAPLNSGTANTIRLETTGQDSGNIDEIEVL